MVIVVVGSASRIGKQIIKNFSDMHFAVVGIDENFLIEPALIEAWIHCSDDLERLTESVNAALTYKAEQFVYLSTMRVHAPCELGQKINEQWPENKNSEYGRFKVACEEVVLKNRDVMPVVIFRCAECYDDWGYSPWLVNQINKIFERQSEALFPRDEMFGISFLHIEDLVDAILLVVEHPTKDARIFLIGEPETVSFVEIQTVISFLLNGSAQKPEWLSYALIWLQNLIYQLDISCITTSLGWAPKHSIREVLPKILAILKEDPLKWYVNNELKIPQHLIEKDF